MDVTAKKKGSLDSTQRAIIPNDTKLFAQADSEETIDAYLTSDTRCIKLYDLLKKHFNIHFQIIDIHDKHSEIFGILDL